MKQNKPLRPVQRAIVSTTLEAIYSAACSEDVSRMQIAADSSYFKFGCNELQKHGEYV